ncbi:MAG: cytochrome c biogenesis protein ResB, partial [Bacteroidales bacterium]|nr:cytochrome c biogenesis protein ResB [Bacteroidales bacterium]
MKAVKILFSPIFMGILFIVFGVSMAVATFVENDFGASAARALIYNSRWFELVFLLLMINLAGQIIIFKLYRREKITVMLFHLAFILMIIGAAITRYAGYDGMMGIREGEVSSTTYSAGQHLVFELTGDDGEMVARHSKPFGVTALTDGRYSKTLSLMDEQVKLTYEGYRYNVSKSIEEVADGMPMVSFLATRDMKSGENLVLSMGERTMLGEISVGFGVDADLTIVLSEGRFFLRSATGLRSTKMADMMVTIHDADSLVPIAPMLVYSVGDYKLVPQKMTLSGNLAVVKAGQGMGSQGPGALEFTLSGAGYDEKIYLWENVSGETAEWSGKAGTLKARVTYGSRIETLPFVIRLNDFILDRYPGSNSPSGYKSNVTLIDEEQGVE